MTGWRLTDEQLTEVSRKGNAARWGGLTESERFWSKVRKTDTCWLWTAGCNSHGYGTFYLSNGAGRVKAHRYAYEQLVGPIPVGLGLLHSCDNPPCVNPAHLSPGDQRENLRQASARGRVRNQTGVC